MDCLASSWWLLTLSLPLFAPSDLLKWFIFPYPLHFLPYTGCTASLGALYHYIYHFYQFLLMNIVPLLTTLTLFLSISLTGQILFASLILVNTAFYTVMFLLSGPSLKPAHLTCIFQAVSSIIISAVVVSLCRPFMNCSFSLTSYSCYLLYVALICNLPIHSWTDSWIFPFILHYWKENMVLLCCSLNFSPSVGKQPFCCFACLFLRICKCLYTL